MKKYLLAGVLALSLLMPTFALAQQGDVDTSPTCVNLQYNLRYRSVDAKTNGEVTLLQSFLQDNGYLTGEPTGYFGTLTRAATIAFQNANSISATPPGFVGAITRAKIRDIDCGGTNGGTTMMSTVAGCTSTAGFSPTTGESCAGPTPWVPTVVNFSASPTSGSAPLLVSFNTSASTDSGEISVDFGDGQKSVFEKGLTHSYASPGLYVATLMQRSPVVCPSGAFCTQEKSAPHKIGTATILVGGSTMPVVAADLKVNGSDGPLTLALNQKVSLSWTTSGMRSCGLGNVNETPSDGTDTSIGSIPLNGSMDAYYTGYNPVIWLICFKLTDGNTSTASDGVYLTSAPTPTAPASFDVRMAGTPTLALSYSSLNGGEAALTASYTVNITAPGKLVLNKPGYYAGDGSLSLYAKVSNNNFGYASQVASGELLMKPVNFGGNDGGTYWAFSPGATNQFVVTYVVDPKKLFAGTYSSSLYLSPTPVGFAGINNNQTNSVTVVGETSPYITSAVSSDGKVVLTGVRFTAVSNTVTMGGLTLGVFASANNGTTITFTPTTFGITPGYYNVQVTTENGASNNAQVNISGVSTSVPNVEFIGTPTLRLNYDPSGKESDLLASATVKITTGNSAISGAGIAQLVQFYRQGYGNVGTNGLRYNLTTSSGFDKSIPANTSATFTINNTIVAKELFAGSYTVSLVGLPYMDANGAYQTVPFSAFKGVTTGYGSGIISGVTPITIVGEVSPYISSVSTDASGNISVTGARFDLVGNTVIIDGTIGVGGTKGDATTMSFGASTYNLANGQHRIQITNAQTGNSNTMYFDLKILGTSAPTVELIGTPRLTLRYDSLGNEATFIGEATVKITAGNSPITHYTYATNVAQILQFYKTSGGAVSANSLNYAATKTTCCSTLTVPANTSETFTIYNTISPRELFAGTYSLGLSGFSYIDASGVGQVVQYSSFKNVSTNGGIINGVSPVTIVGEVSPYITGVTNDATPSVNITITGVRFHPTSNTVRIGTITKTLPSSNNGTSINLQMADFGLTSAGGYQVQVTSPTTGASNNYYTNITSAPQAVAPVVEFIGTPTFRLEYDSAGKEANLVGVATVKVTAGNSSLDANTVNNIPYILYHYMNSSGLVGSNSTRHTAVSVPSGITTIPANSSATFTITLTGPTKEFFAGTYTLGLSGLGYNGANGAYQTLPWASFRSITMNPPGTISGVPSITIVGEVSPYITAVTPTYPTVIASGQTMTISGVRFDPSYNVLLIDGREENKVPSSNNGTTITFVPSTDSGITAGAHTLQIQTANGASNRMSINVGQASL